MCGGGDGERIVFDIEYISVSIDGLKVGDIVSEFGSSSIECESCFPEEESCIFFEVGCCGEDGPP